jgi:hypothetical protein
MHVVVRAASVAAVLLLSAAAVAQPATAGAPAAPFAPSPVGAPAPAVGAPEAGTTEDPARTPGPPGSPSSPAPVYYPQPAPVYPPAGAGAAGEAQYPVQPAPAFPPPAAAGAGGAPSAQYPVQPAPVYPPGPVPYPYPYPSPYGGPAYPGYPSPYPQPRRAPVELVPAQPEGPVQGYHEHDGVFVHLLIGGGYAYTKSDAGATLSGVSPTVSFDVGFPVVHNLILHAGAGINGTPAARVESGGVDRSDSLSDGRPALDFIHFLLGATYYTTAHNLFASLRAGFGQYTLSNSGAKTYKSNLGWLIRGGFGKEWWLGPNWGLGGEAIVSYSRAGSDRTGGLRALGGPFFGAAVVATYQ